MASKTGMSVAQMSAEKLKKARRLVKAGKIVAGMSILEEIIQFDPRSGSVWLDYADALTDVRRFSEALAAYEKALQFAPQNRKGYVFARIGILLEESRSTAAAESYFKDAVESFSEPVAWINVLYGKNLATQERYEDAEKFLAAAADLESSERDEAYLNLAMIYRSKKCYEKARQMALKALDVHSDYAPAKQLLASLEGARESKQ